MFGNVKNVINIATHCFGDENCAKYGNFDPNKWKIYVIKTF